MKKQNYSYIGITFVLLVFGIIFIPKIISRIQGDQIVDMDRHNLEHAAQKDLDLATIGPAPEFQLTNQRGELLSSASLNGQIYVVEFFFTTCPSVCPIMTQNLLKVQSAFADEPGLSLISITINPTFDTPEVLSDYAKKYGITHPNWHLLTGEQDKIYAIANKGFNLYVGPGAAIDGGFEHSGFFALVDDQGMIRSRFDQYGNPIIYYDGLEAHQVSKLINDISVLLKEKS
ncbi:MAG TPA: SCO family protein [Flavobacteriaceae bacterium]|nr:SCO family protein [Flavobacteriaceae bacterium]